MPLTAGAVCTGLGLPTTDRAAVDALAAAGVPVEPVALPDRAEAGRLFDRLGLTAAEVAEALDNRPSPDRDPELWWLLEHCRQALLGRLGEGGELSPWPSLPDAIGATGRYFYPWVFLAVLPDTRRYHQARGIPDQASWEVLAALGAQMANYREAHGRGGVQTQNWLTHHFRGAIYALGRLHFERTTIGFDAAGAPDGGPPPGRGAPALGVHIPEGRLTPESCDRSFAAAAEFFPRHYPDEVYRFGTCISWVLDPQLAEYLDPDSNIMRFQRRFALVAAAPDAVADADDGTVIEFVFKRSIADLDRLPRDTSLQRGLVDHLRAGRHWQFRTGWLRFPAG
jgi:GNAT-like C-terminal domain/N-acyltransferase N-terminal domain